MPNGWKGMRRAVSLLISLSVGIIVWVLSERLFPAAFPAATEGQKIFWGLGIIFAVTIVAESVQLLWRIERRIEQISPLFERRIEQTSLFFERRVEQVSLFFKVISDADLEKYFKDIYKWYYGDFKEIRRWVKKAIKTFHDEMQSGYIYMLPKAARNDMAQMYRTAKEWVVTTNVGRLEFFLQNPLYQELNLQTFGRGVPVIRFFLYNSPLDAQFQSKVRESMKSLKTVCAALINLGDAPINIDGLVGPRDFLLVDQSFVADAELNPTSWEILRIRATIKAENIEKYRRYLRELQGVAHELIGLDEINDVNFNGRAILGRRFPGMSGRQIFRETMDKIGSTERA